MNRLERLFRHKTQDILNIYFTAGYPALEDTGRILKALDREGVDIIEIGMPYSDPIADGPTIQMSGAKALANGMKLDILFEQVSISRKELKTVSLVLMGYYNQVLQYGAERFFRKCKDVGIDGLILPDLPLFEYESLYKDLFEELDLGISFLITPSTDEPRLRKIDRLTRGFIYMVSSSSITGSKADISPDQLAYFLRIKDLQLIQPRLIGFGISDHKSFSKACQFAQGAIIGSAFIKALDGGGELESNITQFVSKIKSPSKS